MANILQTPSFKANNGYSGFDMSHLLKFSSTVGELLPVYKDILQPGDKISISTELRTRTMPLNSAAMMHLTEHLEWFFVPMKQLYTNFGPWYFGVGDFPSSGLSESVAKQLPYSTSLIVQRACEAKADSDAVTSVDSYFPHLQYTDLRLVHMLDVPIEAYCIYANTPAQGQQSIPGPSMHPFFFAAYQKIYHDFYRLSDWENQSNATYNLDFANNTAQVNDSYLTLNFFRLRYRAWSRDFFTNSFPSPLFGSKSIGSSNSLGLSGVNQDLTKSFNQWLVSTTGSLSFDPNDGFATINNSSDFSDGLSSNQDLSTPTAIKPNFVGTQTYYNSAVMGNIAQLSQYLSPTSIRTSFAVQKLLEVTRRAGKTYDEQQLAHFGVKMNRGLDGEVFYLGSQDSTINIGDVIATATSELASGATSVLGQIGGKGYGYGKGKQITFTAPAHGILMCIYSCEPKVDYDLDCVDRLQTCIERADWYTPEFDNLGMQPLFKYQTGLDSSYSSVIGWQYRWQELKMKWNRVKGGFAGSLYYWTPARTSFNGSLEDRLINPSFLDNVMVAKYNPGIEYTSNGDPLNPHDYITLFDSDPLIHELYFNSKKSSKMSTYGLESL